MVSKPAVYAIKKIAVCIEALMIDCFELGLTWRVTAASCDVELSASGRKI